MDNLTTWLLVWSAIASVIIAHNGHHHNHKDDFYKLTLNKQEAHSFSKRSPSECAASESFCEESKEYCRENDEPARENLCSPVNNVCPIGITCYLSVPCPAHYQTSCSYDPCLSYPCANGGTCQRNDTEYSCSCLSPSSRFDSDCRDCRPGPADLVFLLDESISNIDAFNESIDYVISVISEIAISLDDFLVSMVTFSSSPVLHFDFNTYIDNSTLTQAIKNIRVTKEPGATSLDSALTFIHQHVVFNDIVGARDRMKISKYVILLSDGLSSNKSNSIAQATSLRYQGVSILTVGVGTQVAQEELIHIAGTLDHVFSPTNNDLTMTILQETIQRYCSDCSINTAADIMYAIDVSSNQPQFQKVLDAVKILTEMSHSYNPDVYVGMVSFSDTVTTAFDINEHNAYSSLLPATQQVRQDTHKGSFNDVASVLQYIRNVSFTHTNVRNISRKIVALFTNTECSEIDSIIAEKNALYNMDVKTIVIIIGGDIDLECYFQIFNGNDVIFIGDVDSEMEGLNSLVAITKYASCSDTIFLDRQ